MLREERKGDVRELDQAWRDNRLDELPPALGYLLLECGTCASYRAALGWYRGAVSSLGAGVEAVPDPAFFTPRRTLEVAQAVLAARRRRERTSLAWRRDYQQLTNRVNRVQGRVLRLIREQVRESLFPAS